MEQMNQSMNEKREPFGLFRLVNYESKPKLLQRLEFKYEFKIKSKQVIAL